MIEICFVFFLIEHILVGGFNPSEKYEGQIGNNGIWRNE
jgi:hypothetical protein